MSAKKSLFQPPSFLKFLLPDSTLNPQSKEAQEFEEASTAQELEKTRAAQELKEARINQVQAVERVGPALTNSNVPYFCVPRSQSCAFWGRERELAELSSKLILRESDGPSNLGVCVALHGISGSGKTELAIQFAYGHRACYESIIWMCSQNRTALAKSLSAIAKEMVLPEALATDDCDYSQTILRSILRSAKRCLLIFDDVRDWGVLASCWPELSSQSVSSIVTCRSAPPWCDRRIRLQGLVDDAASCLLINVQTPDRNSSESSAQYDLARAVNRVVAGHPGILAHCAAFAKASQISLKELLGLIIEPGGLIRILTQKIALDGSLHSYKISELLNLSHGLPNTAKHLLIALAIFSPDRCPESFFIQDVGGCERFLAFRSWHDLFDTVYKLLQRGLVDRNASADSPSLSIHPAIAKLTLDFSDVVELTAALDYALKTISMRIGPSANQPSQLPLEDHQSHLTASEYLPYLSRLWEIYECYSHGIRPSIQIAELFVTSGYAALASGDIPLAEEFLNTASRIADEANDDEIAARCRIRAQLAIATVQNEYGFSRYLRVLTSRKIALSIAESLEASDSGYVVNSLEALVGSHLEADEYEDVEGIFLRITQNHGEYAKNSSIFHHHKSYVCLRRGHVNQAIALSQHAQSLLPKESNREHVIVIHDALLAARSGRAENALFQLRKTLGSRNQRWTRSEVELYLAIGIIHLYLERYNEAEKCMDTIIHCGSTMPWIDNLMLRARCYRVQILTIMGNQDISKHLSVEADTAFWLAVSQSSFAIQPEKFADPQRRYDCIVPYYLRWSWYWQDLCSGNLGSKETTEFPREVKASPKTPDWKMSSSKSMVPHGNKCHDNTIVRTPSPSASSEDLRSASWIIGQDKSQPAADVSTELNFTKRASPANISMKRVVHEAASGTATDAAANAITQQQYHLALFTGISGCVLGAANLGVGGYNAYNQKKSRKAAEKSASASTEAAAAASTSAEAACQAAIENGRNAMAAERSATAAERNADTSAADLKFRKELEQTKLAAVSNDISSEPSSRSARQQQQSRDIRKCTTQQVTKPRGLSRTSIPSQTGLTKLGPNMARFEARRAEDQKLDSKLGKLRNKYYDHKPPQKAKILQESPVAPDDDKREPVHVDQQDLRTGDMMLTADDTVDLDQYSDPRTAEYDEWINDAPGEMHKSDSSSKHSDVDGDDGDDGDDLGANFDGSNSDGDYGSTNSFDNAIRMTRLSNRDSHQPADS